MLASSELSLDVLFAPLGCLYKTQKNEPSQNIILDEYLRRRSPKLMGNGMCNSVIHAGIERLTLLLIQHVTGLFSFLEGREASHVLSTIAGCAAGRFGGHCKGVGVLGSNGRRGVRCIRSTIYPERRDINEYSQRIVQ